MIVFKRLASGVLAIAAVLNATAQGPYVVGKNVQALPGVLCVSDP
jgi:hypothetical protein